ncbi:hypothetical protein MF672_048635 [Actinomadura sp. ATCC 31491]|uniref:Secreted protein n=1 Tax=Actinomadura luzonensis TaxID=2805427 RepID=A0ABT0GAJ1_9ACTN|nr:hypothetical protein [Actinomadura luzonensis]MCK2221622.1 hypothetical protein [Actinomadura luzonensis]
MHTFSRPLALVASAVLAGLTLAAAAAPAQATVVSAEQCVKGGGTVTPIAGGVNLCRGGQYSGQFVGPF